MAKPTRTPLQRDHDRKQLVALRLQGKTQEAIAAELGVSRQQVGYDLAQVRRQWSREMVADLDGATRAELERLDAIEEDAIAAFAESKAERAGGDPRFLEVRVKTSAQRARLLGLQAPVVVEQRSLALRAEVAVPATEERIRRFAAQFGMTAEQLAAHAARGIGSGESGGGGTEGEPAAPERVTGAVR